METPTDRLPIRRRWAPRAVEEFVEHLIVHAQREDIQPAWRPRDNRRGTMELSTDRLPIRRRWAPNAVVEVFVEHLIVQAQREDIQPTRRPGDDSRRTVKPSTDWHPLAPSVIVERLVKHLLVET